MNDVLAVTALTPVSGLPPRETRTSVGRERDAVVPSPIDPAQLSPQHLRALVLSSAHVWYPFAVIALTPVSGLPPRETRVSTGRELLVVVPLPNSPSPL